MEAVEEAGSKQQVLINVFNESGLVEQRQVVVEREEEGQELVLAQEGMVLGSTFGEMAEEVVFEEGEVEDTVILGLGEQEDIQMISSQEGLQYVEVVEEKEQG